MRKGADLRKRKPRLRKPLSEAFWSKVEIHPGGPLFCWEWQGSADEKGYGRVRHHKRVIRAHRVAFMLEHGHWPEPMCLHHCDNPPCCNPFHLYEGTAADNNRDKVQRGRARGPQGEENGSAKLSDANVRQIRALRGKERQVDIAARYDVSQVCVSKIQRGETWTHV